ncbi:protein SCO1 homolog 2, mitochondrial [Arachis hypogaea]|uniref:protein SCO1 homolog 2, mitochondrial n=1 Tax=Arachis hypogaea TaxID=3818 RepID=UPI003B211092
MPVSRLVLFPSRRHALTALLPRFVPSVSYTKSTPHLKAKSNGRSVYPSGPPSQPSRSFATYALSAALLGFAGFAAFFHYNDERRAVPKEISWDSAADCRKFRCLSFAEYKANCDFMIACLHLCVCGQTCSAAVCCINCSFDSRSRNIVNGPIIGGPFSLINTDKQTVTERNFLGNWVLLYFGYTSSPDIGPEQVLIMAKAIDILESKEHLKILPVFVTIDPQRDTPSQLHAYLKEFDSRIIGLTGPVTAIRQMAQEYRVYFKKVEDDGGDYLVDCSHSMYLLNPNMEVVRCFGVEYNAKELSEAISKELKRKPLTV